jgi:hypothetical protein
VESLACPDRSQTPRFLPLLLLSLLLVLLPFLLLLGRCYCCIVCWTLLAAWSPWRALIGRKLLAFLPLLLLSLLSGFAAVPAAVRPLLLLHCLLDVACCVESLACPDRSQTPRFLPLLLLSLLLVLLPFLLLLGRCYCCIVCWTLLAAWSPWRALIGRKLLAFYRCCSCRCCRFCCRSCCC